MKKEGDLGFLKPLQPAAPPQMYDQEQGGSRNHLSRLLLSTLGGLSPAIEASDVVLLEQSSNLHSAIDTLDQSAPHRHIFHCGVVCDCDPKSVDYISFLQDIGPYPLPEMDDADEDDADAANSLNINHLESSAGFFIRRIRQFNDQQFIEIPIIVVLFEKSYEAFSTNVWLD